MQVTWMDSMIDLFPKTKKKIARDKLARLLFDWLYNIYKT